MELLFEGEVTLEKDDDGFGIARLETGNIFFDGGDTIHFTVNGVTEVFVAHTQNGGIGGFFGNGYVLGGNGVDTGYDFFVTSQKFFYINYPDMNMTDLTLYSRTPGTYTIKIEVDRAIIPQYSYNGTALGPLPPDWDSVNYPYAQIRRMSDTTFHFVAHPELPYSGVSDWDGSLTLNFSGKTECQIMRAYTKLGLWWTDAYFEKYESFYARYVVWANFDIYNEDGSIYMAASEPIPVGATKPIDPMSMLMGWRVGQAIRSKW